MRNCLPHYIGLLLLFCGSCAVYNWIFDYVTVLQYGTSDCFFLFGREFLAKWLDHPGGILFYAGRFLRQFYHYPWLGALAISSLFTGFGFLLYLVLKRLRRRVSLFHAFFPCVFLLSLHSSGVDVAIGLMAVCGAFLGYLVLPRGASRQVYALLATPVLYLAVGGYFWFFISWVIASEWFDRPLSSGLAFKLFYPALAIGVPLVAYRWFFLISLPVAINLMIFTDLSFAGLPFCYIMLFMPFWARIPLGERLESFCGSRRGLAAQGALLVALAAVLLRHSYDPTTRQFADYHRLYKRGLWDAILDRAMKDPLPHRMGQFFTNYALHRKGKLLEEMFNYPQVWGTHGLIFSSSKDAENLRWAMYNSDLFFEMGHVNAAFRFAYNQMNQGRTYANLERVAACNLVNGNYEIAGKYLSLLEKTLFHREFARRYKSIIADIQTADRYFAEPRARRPTFDIDIEIGEIGALLAVLQSDPHNRMAFDYLTAWYLLDKDAISLIAADIGRFAEAGYASLPTHCQEALMVWENSSGTTIDKRGFTYDADTRARFDAFRKQVRQYSHRSSALRGLMPDFGSAYMFYYAIVNPPQLETDIASWILLGREFNSRGRTDEAIGFYRQALRKDPEFADAHAFLGNALMTQGKSAEAAIHYRQILRAEPDANKARWSHGQTDYQQDH